jgi:hypothetical protein
MPGLQKILSQSLRQSAPSLILILIPILILILIAITSDENQSSAISESITRNCYACSCPSLTAQMIFSIVHFCVIGL